MSEEKFEYEDEFEYLDELRESGETNMFGAGAYLREVFGMDKQEARKILSQWMATFANSVKGGSMNDHICKCRHSLYHLNHVAGIDGCDRFLQKFPRHTGGTPSCANCIWWRKIVESNIAH